MQPTDRDADINTSRPRQICVNRNLYLLPAKLLILVLCESIMPTDLTEDDWNLHQATIRSLYLTENRKLQGPGGVMQEMLTKHRFNAT